MGLKRMGFWDKIIFGLGLTLFGIIAFVLIVGVLVSLILFIMDDKRKALTIPSDPLLPDAPAAAQPQLSDIGTAEDEHDERRNTDVGS